MSVFNIAKGRVNELVRRVVNNDPANSAIVVVLLQASETDLVLQDYTALSEILAASNTEADFTNYARKVLTEADMSAPSVDNENNYQLATFPNPVWEDAGGASNNTLTKIMTCYTPDSTVSDDSTIIPLTVADFSVTTSGIDLAAILSDGYFYRA